MVEHRHILVTGAGGFLGRAIVDAIVARGHQVTAVARRDLPVWNSDLVENVAADLGTAQLDPILRGVDVVVHCAARMDGDDAAQNRDTILPTRRIVDAARAMATPPVFVLVSSLSVYGYCDLDPWSEVTEATEIEARPKRRDAYTRAKLAQEEAVESSGLRAWILRVGAVYGPERLWNGHLGVAKGPVLLRTANEGQIPLIHVTSAARAIALAADHDPEPPRHILNLVDSNLPDRPAYLEAITGEGWPKITVPVPWQMLDRLGRVIGGPGLLRPEILRARMMPLRYANARARSVLGWTPEDDHLRLAARAGTMAR
ncbi:NAD-dependent epimerase/dehydratase family protein [Ponticoccus sp. SC2-23]|uniref:NAD-dependent epimerase/dehydratase family protein n=1 Tax=Alexandriicola marinus TaxID=2081710 RepID=UPI000FDB6077|nr:NAD-dependent epimerase/dehydratase family protein [Alexandriicola marinus]MBM1220402.1 NAD-dependent epimerase/dehydratase family protein [Ponticoccus sp. SC6-9]MBM1225088.1 NAD-dependent epimerase/dehydratase family protein [Ponticoccus sp. SC6-15]MBM1228602.1 NAD-dependent epimerase/dehydratase family protein [Ponticoccus sp. SC6-38]MBM1233761.1 NAD-dependent epimerase/dehydratase family protein [Ponticoccus sp. SC6-45]MBM1239103.1 NAD-dependent epimerase/dehydratase family protein [Pont